MSCRRGLDSTPSLVSRLWPPPCSQAQGTTCSAMANSIHSEKSGSDWSAKDLSAYNITFQTQSIIDFFGHELRPIDHLDPYLLSSFEPLTSIPTGISMETCRFLKYLYLISHPNAGDSALNDFMRSVLIVTNFDQQIGAVLCPLYRLPLTTFGDNNREAIPDMCLLSNQLQPLTLLLVQRDKPAFGSSGPEPPLIASAIATFQNNNRNRTKMGLATLDMMTIPCITIVGTRPLFYKVPITQHLSDCVATGQYPMQQTVVTRCGPPAPPEAYEGMEFPDYRHTALRYYDAFRDLAEDCWALILAGL